MNRKRIKFPGAIYHVMNRGILGMPIFEDDIMKKYFIKMLKRYIKVYNISLFAYVIMPNHYHLLLRDNDENISEFMKALNSMYASMYRKHYGGKGYVFQNRYKAVIVKSGIQFINTFLYIMANPMRAGLIEEGKLYPWTSIRSYFSKTPSTFIETNMIEEIFITKQGMRESLKSAYDIKANEIETRWGNIMGNRAYIQEIYNKANHRKSGKIKPDRRITKSSISEVISDNKELRYKLKKLPVKNSSEWIELRKEVLVYLRSRGVKYNDIARLELFSGYNVKYLSSLHSKIMKNLHKTWKNVHRPS